MFFGAKEEIATAMIIAGVNPDTFGDISMPVAGPGSDEDDSVFRINGPNDVNLFLDGAMGATTTKQFLSRLSSARINPSALKNASAKPAVKAIKRLAKVSRGLLVHTGKIEAERLNRPNTLASIYGTALAPGASVAFTVQPGAGMSYYRFLGFCCDDANGELFGFSSLRIGGQDMVAITQTAPTPPVANTVPWAPYQLREPYQVNNLNPWTGQVFDNNTSMTGTITNMSTAGAGDAVTKAPRIVILLQTDPCGQRTVQQIEAGKQFWASLQRQGNMYQTALLGQGRIA